jgi:thiol-disulfide isomerase/thioredoxin
MRRRLYSVAALAVVGILGSSVHAQQAARNETTPAALLELRPVLQGVEYDTPADQAAIDACKVESVFDDQQRAVGYALRDGQGKLLRRFVIAHGSRRLDQWSYYQDGFEVYREDDLNGDRSLDECRWMNSGGSRIAQVQQGKIKGWRQISAEEASKVLVHALVNGDIALLETVMASPVELAAAGVPKDAVDKIAAAAGTRAAAVDALRKKLVGWNKQTIWSRFDGTFPHVIPADSGSGINKDLTLYENAMVIPGTTAVQQNAAKLAFLQVADMIQLGATWKLIELPRAIDPEQPIVASVSGIRSMIFDKASSVEVRDEAFEAALKALADYDAKNVRLLQGGDKKDIARYHVGRVPLLRDLAKKSKNSEEQLTYNKQVVDSLVAAFRTGLYPQGRKPLDQIVADGGKLGSYAAYTLIDAEFAMKNEEPGANILFNQKKWMADLENFIAKFPSADEVPAVLFHLATANEFNGDEDKARKQYGELVKNYTATDAGKKAAGALRRLDLVGNSLVIKGTGLRNEAVDSSQYRGKPVVIVFWATWATPAVEDLPRLKKLYDTCHGRGLEVIGVNLDNDRRELDAFLANNPVAWPQIFEPGGTESRLAVEYGIISLPTMLLCDDKGKVVNRSVRNSLELEPQLDKLLPPKEAGVALDRKD